MWSQNDNRIKDTVKKKEYFFCRSDSVFGFVLPTWLDYLKLSFNYGA